MYVRIEIIHDEPQTVVFALEPEKIHKISENPQNFKNPQNFRKSAKFQKIRKVLDNGYAGAVLKLNLLVLIFKQNIIGLLKLGSLLKRV